MTQIERYKSTNLLPPVELSPEQQEKLKGKALARAATKRAAKRIRRMYWAMWNGDKRERRVDVLRLMKGRGR
jgi:hypothetical protein